MNKNFDFDAIVVGGGHAGIEAALALSRTGNRTLMLCLNLDSIGLLACNPSIGGTAKGHLVCEIDALGGEMGVAADKTLIQLRMLNSSKGAAVQSLRAQTDKYAYHNYMKKLLENAPLLTLKQAEASAILTSGGEICGIETSNGLQFSAKKVVLACGVYLNSRTITGELVENKGPSGMANATFLSDSLVKNGIDLRRFKTGTPARVHRDSIDLTKLEVQAGEKTLYSFSALSKKTAFDKAPCWLGYTNLSTHQVIKDNIAKAPMYSGTIKGIGARYCPSIEDKIVRFADKERHQFFLEPEGLSTKEMYVQGISTSMPAEVQLKIYQSIEGFENIQIMRDAYAIEYDCIDSTSLYPTLESKIVSGLYFAGQINGTSGYEEAAAQGLVAGINAANALAGRKPLILKRNDGYIGVLIDDLTTKGTNEPYRMMTSRAEFRLSLRQDNADLRLTEYAIESKLATKQRILLFKRKKNEIAALESLLPTVFSPKIIKDLLAECDETPTDNGMTLEEIFKRNFTTPEAAKKHLPLLAEFSLSSINQVMLAAKYSGYLSRQQRQIENFSKLEEKEIPSNINYETITGLRIEAIQKLSKICPKTLGIAGRISGVSPADINVLILYLTKHEQ